MARNALARRSIQWLESKHMFSARGLAAAFLAIGLACLPIRVEAQNVKVVASATPLNRPQGVVVDPSGNIYVANTFGPGGINSSIIKIAPDGTTSTQYTAPASEGETCFGGLARGPDGTFYVTDGCNARVLRVTPAGIMTTIADGTNGLVTPVGLALDQSGDIYASDLDANTIVKITSGGAVSTYVPASAGLSGPWGITIDGSGNLYVANSGQGALGAGTNANMISKVTSGSIVWNFGAYNLYEPASLAVDPSGYVYVAAAGRIFVCQPDGFIYSLTPTFVDDFNAPYGMAYDGAGNLLVADARANSLSKISTSYVESTMVQSNIAGLGTPAVDAAGNLYVPSFATQSVLKIAPNGSSSAYVTAAQGLRGPTTITFDRSGNLFVMDRDPENVSPSQIVKVTPAGAASVLVAGVDPAPIVADSAGNLFTTSFSRTYSGVLKITPQGAVSTFVPTSGKLVNPAGLAIDQQDNLYVGDLPSSAIFKITPAGAMSTIVDGSQGFSPYSLALSGDGTLYVASYYQQSVAAVGPGGTLSIVAQYAPGQTTAILDVPGSIAYDNNSGLYISDTATSSVLRLDLSPSQVAAAVLPGSRSVQVGKAATVFATMINGAGTALSDCAPALSALAPTGLSMSFQTTNATTNALTGVANEPVAIPANGAQSFVLAFQSSAPLSALAFAPIFSCQGAAPATTLPGVNTVDLTFSTTPVADIIALAATTTKDGTLHLGQGAAAFAVATVDAGATGALTASVDTGAVVLPLTALLCQTSSNGQCLTPAAPSIAVNFTANADSTFSVFASATGQIPFAPGTSRLFVRFTDSSGAPHGSTSVAATTN